MRENAPDTVVGRMIRPSAVTSGASGPCLPRAPSCRLIAASRTATSPSVSATFLHLLPFVTSRLQGALPDSSMTVPPTCR